MTFGLTHTLLLLSLPLLSGLGGTGLMVVNAQKRDARLAARVASLTLGSRAPAVTDVQQVVRAAATVRASPLASALALFGCDYERREIYPVPWWVVLPVALGIGRIAVTLVVGIVGPIGWAVWPCIWVLAARTAFGYWEGKRRDLMLKQFPDALAIIVRCARVGVPVTDGIRIVARESPAPTGPEFDRLADEIAIGTSLDTALRATASRTGMPEYRFFATVLTLQAQAGGGLSESLDMLAEIIRKRVALKARGYALTSEGRTSTIVLCVIPVLIIAMLLVLNPPYIMIMFTDPAGRKMLNVGAILMLTAIFVMRKMIRSTLA
jgi:tight adherence protein B